MAAVNVIALGLVTAGSWAASSTDGNRGVRGRRAGPRCAGQPEWGRACSPEGGAGKCTKGETLQRAFGEGACSPGGGRLTHLRQHGAVQGQRVQGQTNLGLIPALLCTGSGALGTSPSLSEPQVSVLHSFQAGRAKDRCGALRGASRPPSQAEGIALSTGLKTAPPWGGRRGRGRGRRQEQG